MEKCCHCRPASVKPPETTSVEKATGRFTLDPRRTMLMRQWQKQLWPLLLVLFAVPTARCGIVFTSLYSFGAITNSQAGHLPLDGAYPTGTLIQGTDGYFYGTTTSGGGGGGGTVFMLLPFPTVYTLNAFGAYPEGANPQAGLVQRAYDGSLYGTTYSGGTNSVGTVFKIIPFGITNLVSFNYNGSNVKGSGAHPYAGLVEGSDGNFYGTTQYGGTNDAGTVFQITFNGRLTTLYSFTGGSDGAYPEAALVQGVDGNFYGTTTEGGWNNAGTVYQIATNGTLTTLYSFTGGDDGYFPSGGLVEVGPKTFIGTTQFGGTNGAGGGGYGTIFMMTNSTLTSNWVLTTLVSFDGTNGARPQAALLLGADGNLYGTASEGGPTFNPFNRPNGSYGTIFKLAPDSTFTTLYSFGENYDATNEIALDGSNPIACLVQGADSSFYGTTYGGGTNGDYGTIFRLSFSPPVIQSLMQTNGALGFSWNAVERRTYQVQYATDLTRTNWTNLGGTIFATNETMTAFEQIGPDQQGFYRVVLLP
jgi:uncharacterized repeat protein (TIGR03803 family)